MKWIRMGIAYLKSFGTFLHTLFQRKDHLDWEKSPTDEILQAFKDREKEELPEPKMALYCYKGNHEGEIFLLNKNIETLGFGAEHSQVITPTPTGQKTTYQILLNPEFKMLAQPGFSFVLNGIEQREAELYDFDELEVLGNQFLILDLSDQKKMKIGALL